MAESSFRRRSKIDPKEIELTKYPGVNVVETVDVSDIGEGEVSDNADALQRRLDNRQIQLIAIGGSIGRCAITTYEAFALITSRYGSLR